jgi:hypothetical protein
VFTADGAVPIDNNTCEREMKRIVLNRKNSLFVGNERGGETAAIFVEPHQHLPPAQHRSATISDGTADEPAGHADQPS